MPPFPLYSLNFVLALDRIAIECTALQMAHCITKFKTGLLCPGEEDEIFHSVVVDIFAAP